MTTTTTIDDENNLVSFKNSGYRTTETVALAESTVRQQFEKNGKVLLLIDWTEFQGETGDILGLIWNVAKLSLLVERVALISGENMKSEVEKWQDKVEEVPIRHFGPEEFSDARTWLITSDEKAVDI